MRTAPAPSPRASRPLLLLLLATLLSGCVVTSEYPRSRAGSVELRAGGSVLLDRDDADNRSDQLRIEGQLLYALSPHFSVGPYVQYGEIDDEIAGIDLAYKEQTLLGLTVLANFAAEGWVIPYALVSVGHADVEVKRGFLNESDTGPFVSGGLGLRAFLRDAARHYDVAHIHGHHHLPGVLAADARSSRR